jgi:hypothetical protein
MNKMALLGLAALTAVGVAGCSIPKGETTPEKPSAKPVAQNVPVHLGGLTMTVTDAYRVTGERHYTEPKGNWLVVKVHVENTGYESASLDPLMQTYVMDGRRYNASIFASDSASVAPGFSDDARLAFDLPVNAFVERSHNSSFLELHDGMTAPTAYVTISQVTLTPCVGLPSEC